MLLDLYIYRYYEFLYMSTVVLYYVSSYLIHHETEI